LTSGSSQRLAAGGLINRSIPIGFRFDGKSYTGFQGDTLASALLAANVRVFARSFKYHRPRGVMTAGSEEPNALVELRTGARREPNSRATVVEIFEGLEARSQNCWPSVQFDLGAINTVLSPVVVAGFYYKTFMWPKFAWERLYEPAIRRAAGLGRSSGEADPDCYERSYAFCDVLVIGAGPAGLAAAMTAARSGARVIVCDEDFAVGGRLNSDCGEIDGVRGSCWAEQVVSELGALPDTTFLQRATVFGAYDAGGLGKSAGRTFGALERVSDHLAAPLPHQPRQRLWKIVAKRTVIATGAIERPIVFGGNDRPGIMLASAVRTFLNRFAVVPGNRLAIITTCDNGWQTAFDLAAVSRPPIAVIDTRPNVSSVLVRAARAAGVATYMGAQIVDTAGWKGVHGVTMRDCKGRRVKLRVDAIAVSGGWSPNLAISTHLGSRPEWSEALSAFVPGHVPSDMSVVGAACGNFTLAQALIGGSRAGADAALALGFTADPKKNWKVRDEPAAVSSYRKGGSRGKAFVDFQNDVTKKDLAIAACEGFTSPELLKRYTTLGMATDQGKTSIVNGMEILSAITGRPISAIGTTTYRPPYTPISIGALAGRSRGKHFRPTRLTPSHDWAIEVGATFIEAGEWLRARWFGPDERLSWLAIVSSEVRAVRTRVGVCDVSTLGKIDVQGSDAARFLDYLYINPVSTLSAGKVRYGLMLREDGFAMDDGTIARLAAGRFVLSTTTANVARVVQHLEHARQVLWPDLDVQIVPITEQWAQYAIAGPRARDLIQVLIGGALDVSNVAFPYLACAEFVWHNTSARLFRVSFSGELGYELAVPANSGDAAIRAIMDVGKSFDVVPYGTEALGVMRIEKGHVAGPELNGTTTAGDLGLARMMSTKKDFIGRVMSGRSGLSESGRSELVGIMPVDVRASLNSGAHLLPLSIDPGPDADQGHVTSAAFSPALGHWIGLGLLHNGRNREGEIVRAYDPLRGSDVEVRVVATPFYDPEGIRLRA
jgi:sarcosine oxidase subunit alpha